MKLYHGTSSRHLNSIIDNGLLPRGQAKSKYKAASASENVYLTTAYGFYFANNSRIKQDEDLLLIEVDTNLLPDPNQLCADEDSAFFAWKAGIISSSFAPPASALDMEAQAQHFASILPALSDAGFDHTASLSVLGNCSYHGTILPSAISRIIRYSTKEGPWWISFHDPVISNMNYRFLGAEYRATQMVVAGRIEEARQIEYEMCSSINLDDVEALCAPRRTFIEPTCLNKMTP